MSCDWETVKNVVPGNSSMKPDQTVGDGKGVKQSEMFNYSVYSRLGNKKNCLSCKYYFYRYMCLFIYISNNTTRERERERDSYLT